MSAVVVPSDDAASSSVSNPAPSSKKRDDGPAALKARKLYTFAEARRKARSYGFATRDEFLEYECAGTYQLPKNCHEVWSEEWTDWDDFLGVPLTYDVAREEVVPRLVKEEVGVESEESYIEFIKSGEMCDDDLASRLPLRPDLYYKAEWTSWDDFLGVQ